MCVCVVFCSPLRLTFLGPNKKTRSQTHKNKALLAEAMLEQLNELGYPNADTPTLRSRLRSLLQALEDVFVLPETADFFYVNDLNVLIDVVLRELTNLPMTDELT